MTVYIIISRKKIYLEKESPNNVSDVSVNFTLYADSDFSDFMWYGRTAQPSESRYTLPKLTITSKTTTKED